MYDSKQHVIRNYGDVLQESRVTLLEDLLHEKIVLEDNVTCERVSEQ